MGYDLRSASGNAKLLNLASNYASVITVVLAGKVLYAVALPAAVFGVLGHLLGSGFALKKGAKFIRPMMLCVLCLLLGNLCGRRSPVKQQKRPLRERSGRFFQLFSLLRYR